MKILTAKQKRSISANTANHKYRQFVGSIGVRFGHNCKPSSKYILGNINSNVIASFSERPHVRIDYIGAKATYKASRTTAKVLQSVISVEDGSLTQRDRTGKRTFIKTINRVPIVNKKVTLKLK